MSEEYVVWEDPDELGYFFVPACCDTTIPDTIPDELFQPRVFLPL